ncbi:dihydrodipicolinate synthase family protein [Halalkalibacillus halophilus]|uniref:dihydrodipicolinate synthase family protein n=1 Tax=Halalkalibacillus halophilus TaxID=392827 RepID=UPI00055461FA|nr:dihydrodipicolinate synthase family protein [Halalkalibacillus halophilus]
MDKYSVDWKGYIPAITLPFDAEEQIDWQAYETLLNWLVEEGMHGLVINGTTGEWFSLTDQEIQDVFMFVGRVVGGSIPVIAGCTGYTAKQVTKYVQWAKESGLQGALIAPPPYMVPNEEEVFRHYQDISNSIDFPICVYNWPRGTQIDMNPKLLKRLTTLQNVVAIKNSTPQGGEFIQALLEVGEDVRYFGVPMNAFGISLIERHKADGLMGAGAVLGRVHPDFFNHVWNGEAEKAILCGEKDQLLFKHFFNSDFSVSFGSQQAILKTALNIQGLPGGHVRSPLLDLSPEEVNEVRKVMSQVSISVKG